MIKRRNIKTSLYKK